MIFGVHNSLSALHRHHSHDLGGGKRQAQRKRRTRLVAQLIEEKYIVAVAPHEQRFRCVAGHRPGLNQWVERSTRICDQHQDALYNLIFIKNRHKNTDVRHGDVRADMQIGHDGRAGVQRLGQYAIAIDYTLAAAHAETDGSRCVNQQDIDIIVMFLDGAQFGQQRCVITPFGFGQFLQQQLHQERLFCDFNAFIQATMAPVVNLTDLELRHAIQFALDLCGNG